MAEITAWFAFYDLSRLGHRRVKSPDSVKDLGFDAYVFLQFAYLSFLYVNLRLTKPCVWGIMYLLMRLFQILAGGGEPPRPIIGGLLWFSIVYHTGALSVSNFGGESPLAYIGVPRRVSFAHHTAA